MSYENRPLGSTEKIFWLLDQTAPVHAVMSAEISGGITVNQCRAAIDQLQQRHPLFSVAIDSNGYKYPRFKAMPGQHIPLRVKEGYTHADVEQAMAHELATPFNWQQAPLLRMTLLRNENSFVLVFCFYHSISDGMSGLYIFRDFLQLLSGETLAPLAFPPSADELLNLPVDAAHPITEVTALKRKELAAPTVAIVHLSTALTAQLIDKARSENATVNSALCAAFTLATRQVSPLHNDNPVRITVPIATRAAIDAGEDSALYIGSTSVHYAAHGNDSFWDMARAATTHLKTAAAPEKLLAGYAGAHQWIFGESTAAQIAEVLQNSIIPREFMISNLVRWPFATTYGNYRLQAVMGPLALSGYPGDYTIGVITTQGSLCLSYATRTLRPALLETAVRILEAAC
ncbi:condensation domain-containing protein [Deminuibacter soli]|uniref:Phthiocerol/phthiodiolone dimycocerosyl transferase n=1 Tax=Deminuibacter soli TaxID=2291815 RepID=A0A3E1NCW1_9BACT|nr:condensation domain-containing protein [Deminuibacter soli]RFM25780.1 hypothetical protein DXN05_23420 [Deminuibacter soli]